MVRHKTRLGAELTKARVRLGFATVEHLRAYLEDGSRLRSTPLARGILAGDLNQGRLRGLWASPRWVRINTLRTTLEEQLQTTFSGFKKIQYLQALLDGSLAAGESFLHVDKHIPNLLAISPSYPITRTPAYRDGLIILQDKASCFPAYLLDPKANKGHILDACSAPGNKATHLAAIIREQSVIESQWRIWACERDIHRAATLKCMIQKSGADKMVSVQAGLDFLRIQPEESPWNAVTSLLLDPSCSGSGIVGRNEIPAKFLPERHTKQVSESGLKKRKRTRAKPMQITTEVENDHSETEKEDFSDSKSRIGALAAFQLKLLLHAFTFPQAHRITYSTCSVYSEENEHVIFTALASPIARKRHWRILKREEQVDGASSWTIRGQGEPPRETHSCYEEDDITATKEACIRCRMGTQEGTQGFFVAAFVRDGVGTVEIQSASIMSSPESSETWSSTNPSDARHDELGTESEWEGFE